MRDMSRVPQHLVDGPLAGHRLPFGMYWNMDVIRVPNPDSNWKHYIRYELYRLRIRIDHQGVEHLERFYVDTEYEDCFSEYCK